MNYTFDKKITKTVMFNLNPVWSEGFQFRGVGDHPKELFINLICWNYHPDKDPEYMGEIKLAIKKFYKESEGNGCHCVEKWLKLTQGKNRKAPKKIAGEIKLRFIAF